MNKWLLPAFVIALTGCAEHSARTFTPISTAALSQPLEATSHSIKSAQVQAKAIYSAGVSPKSQQAEQLQITLATADSQADAAQKALADFKLADAAQIRSVNSEVKTQTVIADNAKAAVAKVEPRHKRDVIWLFVAYTLGSFCCFAGPFLRAAWAPLMVVPASLAGLAAAIAGGVLFAAVASLLIAFGVL